VMANTMHRDSDIEFPPLTPILHQDGAHQERQMNNLHDGSPRRTLRRIKVVLLGSNLRAV
jgi:hypothetical protein